MKCKAIIRLEFPSERYLEIILKALGPEAKIPPTRRFKSILERESTFLVLRIEANDTTALRAALNAYLRWINSIKDVLELLQKHFTTQTNEFEL